MQTLNKIRHILFFIFLGLITLSLFSYSIFGKEISIETVRLYTDSLGLWLPLSFVIIFTILAIFVPMTPLMVIAGIIFGFRLGFIYTSIGALLSSVITFYISRILGKDMIERFLHHKFLSKLESYDNKIASKGILTVAILRMTPIMPFNILSLLMGISKVSTFDYTIGTIIGLVPSNALTVYFGKFIFELVTGRVASALLGLSIVIVFTILYFKNKK